MSDSGIPANAHAAWIVAPQSAALPRQPTAITPAPGKTQELWQNLPDSRDPPIRWADIAHHAVKSCRRCLLTRNVLASSKDEEKPTPFIEGPDRRVRSGGTHEETGTMTMMTWKWKRTGSGLIAGAAVALLLSTSALPALAAAPTWSVSPGGAAVAKSGTTILKDTKTKTVLKCVSSVAKVTLKKGHHLSGVGLASITAISFNKCTGPLGIKFTVKSSHLPWKLNAVAYNKTTGTTTGTITGIHATLSGPGCSAIVDGTGATKNNGMVKATYSNKTHKLTVLATGGNLHIFKVAGCFGLIKNGDGSSYTSVDAVSPAQKITSP
jgi:hypothetical protein